MNKNNLILIGMPGAGKSTIGVVLAKVMGYNFLDSDILIQEKTGKLLTDIINNVGIDSFVLLEDKICSNINTKNTVIATGGSVIYGTNAMKHLKDLGTVIYLKQDFGTINSRIEDIDNRGVVLKEGQTFEDLYNERCPYYEKYADIIIDEGNNTIEDTLKIVINRIKNS